jgi:formate hydrogenlyase subunit 6/NADH:ubiquinone oxidoreductase subunit I
MVVRLGVNSREKDECPTQALTPIRNFKLSSERFNNFCLLNKSDNRQISERRKQNVLTCLYA